MTEIQIAIFVNYENSRADSSDFPKLSPLRWRQWSLKTPQNPPGTLEPKMDPWKNKFKRVHFGPPRKGAFGKNPHLIPLLLTFPVLDPSRDRNVTFVKNHDFSLFLGFGKFDSLGPLASDGVFWGVTNSQNRRNFQVSYFFLFLNGEAMKIIDFFTFSLFFEIFKNNSAKNVLFATFSHFWQTP